MEVWIGPFLITIAYTVIAVILGLTAKGKLDINVTENWAASGNTLGVFCLIFLVGAGNVSAYTFLGSPGWSWAKGVPALYVIVYLVLMTITGYLVNPRITELGLKEHILTQAEGFGIRYESQFLRALAAIVATIAGIGASLVQAIGVGYILNVMSGGNIPQWLGSLIVLIAIFIYVYASGLRAIGWTNVFQGIVMFVIAYLVGGYLIVKTTGSLSVGAVFTRVAQISPEHLTLPGAQGDMSLRFWTTAILISMVSLWPQFWIWATGGRSANSVRRTAVITPLYYFVMLPMIIVGFICIYAFPEAINIPQDKVALTFSLHNLPWWMAGILGAGVLAASQSTCESQFHVAALTLSHDVIKPFNVKADEGKLQRILLLPVMFGLAFPLACWNPSNLVYILLVAYGFMGQIFPLIIGIFVWPRSTKAGAMAGLVAGVVVVALCNIVWQNPLGIHAGVWGLLFNIPIHIIISLCTAPASETTLRRFFKADIMDRLYE